MLLLKKVNIGIVDEKVFLNWIDNCIDGVIMLFIFVLFFIICGFFLIVFNILYVLKRLCEGLIVGGCWLKGIYNVWCLELCLVISIILIR